MDESTDPFTFHLVTHKNTEQFGSKALIYIGNRKSIEHTSQNPTNLYVTTHTVNVPQKPTNITYVEYCKQIIAIIHSNNFLNDWCHNACVIEIQKEDEEAFRKNKHQKFTKPSPFRSLLFPTKNTALIAPWWYDETITAIQNTNYIINFIVTDNQSPQNYQQQLSFLIVKQVLLYGSMSLLLLYCLHNYLIENHLFLSS